MSLTAPQNARSQTRQHSQRRRRPHAAALLTEALVMALGLVLAIAVCACGGGGGATTAPESTEAPVPQAWSATVVDRRDGTVLYAKEADRHLPPASVTKIMTALLVLEHERDLDRYATVPRIHLPQTVGVDLRPGDRITIEQALRALMVKSANDAALTLAADVGGSEPGFVKLMNARATKLGLTNTHFMNCRGTPEPGHYSSAADLATLGRVAMRDPRFRSLVRIKRTVIRYPPDNAVPVESHNRLLDYPWGDGIKTGATTVSKMVLAGSGQPGLVPLIVVTMHEPDRAQEVEDAVALFMWASKLYERRTIVTAGDAVTSVPLAGGGEVTLAASASLSAVVRTGASVRQSPAVPATLASRPAAGMVIGSVAYSSGDLDLGAVDLVAASATPDP